MAHFYFALTNVDAESLLKEEISIRYPDLKLSYSRPGFLTFKAETPISFTPLFARVSGICTGKLRESEVNFPKAWVWARNDKIEIPSRLKEISEKSLYRIGEEVTLVMMVGSDEFWVGHYPLLKTHFQTPGEVSSIEVKDVPSRAYYKIAEAFEAFDLPFDHQEKVLELGSAPGGASLFLLEQDMKVLGVDPAEMDPRVKKNIDFKHLKKPFETLNSSNLPEDIDWIVSDINLPPTVVMKEVWRLLHFLEPRGLILTLKMNESKHLEFLASIRAKMRANGFNQVEIKYLPSHKKEIALICLRS